MAVLKFIPNATSKTASGGVQLNLDDIPQDVRENVEEVYTTLKTNPGRIRVDFESLAELNTYIAQMRAYCELRPEALGGPVRFRKSPARKLPATSMEFRITDLQTEAEAETEGIRDAVDAVKTAAKPGPAKK